MGMTRREFAGAVAAFAAAGPGAVRGEGDATAAGAKDGMIWAAFQPFGRNMWSDIPVKKWQTAADGDGEGLLGVCAADHVRFDEAVWRRVADRMAARGLNTVVLDVGEALAYPSHPELWVKGSWEIDRFRKELARLRGMGIEPIPKMNF